MNLDKSPRPMTLRSSCANHSRIRNCRRSTSNTTLTSRMLSQRHPGATQDVPHLDRESIHPQLLPWRTWRKTGFTSQAGRTYVGAMERDGHRLIVAVMRSAESTERAVNSLFEWGFANINKVKPVDQLVEPQPEDELTPVPAASYDEQGQTTVPQVAVVETSSAGTSRTRCCSLLQLALPVSRSLFGVDATRGVCSPSRARRPGSCRST